VRDQASLLSLEAYVPPRFSVRKGKSLARCTANDSEWLVVVRAPITELEAMLVEVLSCSVAPGSRACSRTGRVGGTHLFEQFFTPNCLVAASGPTLLSGKDANVTVLFCDIVVQRISNAWEHLDLRLD